MRRLKRIAGSVAALSLVLGLAGPISVSAATAPDLGAAATYSVYGDAGVTNDLSATTHVWGNVGHNGLGATNLDDATQVDGVIDVGAGVAAAASAAYDALAAQGATGALDLDGGGNVTPGVYTVGATALNGTLTLDGAGVYIFRSSSSISTSGAAVVNLINGATACNVFWQIPTSMTIGAGSVIEGTIITQTGLISLGSGASLKGRALAKTQVTLIANQITEPVCAAAAPPAAPSGTTEGATLNVVKTVINDNGRTNIVADFPLFVNGTPVDSGVTYTFPLTGMPYVVTETSNPNYTRTFSGDCDVNGNAFLLPGDHKFCIITNNDIGAAAVPVIPPIIDVIKVPSPLALPAGPGPVTYTYTVRNIGVVPMTNVTLVGDTCSPIVLQSGDTNGNAVLETDEVWVHTCTTNLTATHTNTVVATGWANGVSATDIASATVVVGAPLVPPLIHITKVPSPLTLNAAGGMVTYTKTVTNPGTVPLRNVRVADDKCGPVSFTSGDTNGNSLLDPSESWIYTCRTNLTSTTINTATAAGDANGMIARDFALATVVVAAAVPALPVTGAAPAGSALVWLAAALGICGASLILYGLRKKQTE